MDNVKGYFIKAEMTRPKDESKPSRLILNVLLERGNVSDHSTGGTLKEIWILPHESIVIWQLVKDCKLGDVIELEPVIYTRNGNDYVNYIPVSV